jgi:hypothetical protein
VGSVIDGVINERCGSGNFEDAYFLRRVFWVVRSSNVALDMKRI